MFLSWRSRRKYLFIIILIILILGLAFYKIYPSLKKAPTCSDNIQNGDETGIDCGGSCSKICKVDVLPFNIKFARAVQSEKGLYDLVALVENKNKDKDTSDGNINYTFDVYDKAGIVVKSVTGVMSIPLGQSFPIVYQNVPIDLSDSGDVITKVILRIDNNLEWVKADSTYANTFFKITDTSFTQDRNNSSQLSVTVQNITPRATFRNIPIAVIISDEQGNVIAVNQSFIKEIKAKNSIDIPFTWRSPLSISNPKIDVYVLTTPYSDIK